MFLNNLNLIDASSVFSQERGFAYVCEGVLNLLKREFLQTQTFGGSKVSLWNPPVNYIPLLERCHFRFLPLRKRIVNDIEVLRMNINDMK